MIDPRAGDVANAMHRERLVRAAANLRLAEAERTEKRGRQPRRRRSYRRAMAGILVALALKIAPS
ncbi:MAG TPA: hypothetical protein VIC60_08765 [Thermomicrobiales bacterium]|jgi:hypothetical protein